VRPILFLVSAASSYRLLKYVADQLVRDGKRVCFLYERGSDPTFDLVKRDAAALGGEAFALETIVDPAVASGPAWRRHPRRLDALAIWLRVTAIGPGLLHNLIARLLPSAVLKRIERNEEAGEVSRMLALRVDLSSRLAAARSLLRTLNPGAIVSCDDGIAAALPVHAAARQEGLPVVVVPYGYGVRRDLEIALDAKAALGALATADGPWGEVIRARAPQWIKRGPHEGAMMHLGSYILAAESLGITLRDAWIIHGGYADRLCVESEQMQRVYLEEGVPPRKLALTGTPYCDVMVRALERDPAARAALRQPRTIECGRTRILVSWPPSYHGDRAAFSEFASYREMSLATLGWLGRLPNCTVTVSLHPATLAEDRQALIDIGVQLTDAYVIELIPLSDLFITYFSSTIRWAVAAGKPVINFDLYKLGLAVYDAAPGVLTVSTLAGFQREVTSLTTSDAAFAEVAARQIAVAPQWGVLDGLNTARVAAEIEKLAAA
jgi:hypothetical protein